MTRCIARWSFVLAVLVAASAAFAQMGGPMLRPGPFEFRAACGHDVRRLCSSVPRGEGRILGCLASRYERLSPACRTELAAGADGGAVPYPRGGLNAYAPGHGLGGDPGPYGPNAYGPGQYGPGRNPSAYDGGADRDGGGLGIDPNRYGFDAGAQAHPPRPQRYASTSPMGSIVTRDGATRTYAIHIPAGYDASKTYPLVLLFHGGGGNGSHFLSRTRFGPKADKDGFIVVAPDGIDRHWNDGRGTTNPDVDDVGFVKQLIADLKSRLPIDEKRIYATGVSNGGFFVERLGCELSETLAAIGPDVGPMPANLLSSCKPEPIAVVGIQGAADSGIPLNGGEMGGNGNGGVVVSAEHTMKLWATADSCNPSPTVTSISPRVNDGTKVIKYSYAGCTAGTDVVYYVVQGMGHGWPPLEGALDGIATSRNINATKVIWDFFSAHSR